MKIKVPDQKAQIFIDSHAGFLKKNLSHRSHSTYNRIRSNLNSLRKHGAVYDGIVMSFIYAVKRYQEAAGHEAPKGYIHRKHTLTDHAFCSALERMYGIDILKIKDRVLEDIEQSNVRYVAKDGLIITVLGD